MLPNILLPTDGAESSGPVLDVAIDWVKHSGGKLVVLSVAGTLSYSPLAEDVPSIDWQAYEARQRERAQRLLDEACARARAAGIACEPVLEQSDDLAGKIVETAQRLHCDAIFMATHRRSRLMRLFAGSQTQKVLARTNLPVLVFH